LRPASWQAVVNRARAYRQMGEMEKALVDYRVAGGLNPDDPFTSADLGNLLTQQGQIDEGREYLAKAAKLEPDHAPFHADLAVNLLAHGKEKASSGDATAAAASFDEAAAAARKSLEIDPDLPGGHVTLASSLVERSRLAATPDRRLLDEAISHYAAALSVCGGKVQAPGLAATCSDALVSRCDALIQTGELEQALTACRSVVEAQPENPNAHYNLAGVHALRGDREAALASLEKDIELGDTDHEYLAADKWFASLHADRRFKTLLEKMKTGGGR
ncbi:MAG TPA: tetratricopeptide repeat protein, partial [Candidatus Polarisedimenticolia bacterium]|nr:tetratricopeptide repeat protein [Candidatus Polarisedimenticolia bacterium]